jgi:hypothetical protein
MKPRVCINIVLGPHAVILSVGSTQTEIKDSEKPRELINYLCTFNEPVVLLMLSYQLKILT